MIDALSVSNNLRPIRLGKGRIVESKIGEIWYFKISSSRSELTKLSSVTKTLEGFYAGFFGGLGQPLTRGIDK